MSLIFLYPPFPKNKKYQCGQSLVWREHIKCTGSRAVSLMHREVGRRQGADQPVWFVQQICSVWTAEIAEIHLYICSIVCHHREYTYLLHFFILSKRFKGLCFQYFKMLGIQLKVRVRWSRVELVCKATLKHMTFWKGRTKSRKWVLKNARQVKSATPCHQDFIRNTSGTKVPLNDNFIPCFPLQHFQINH